MKNKLIPLSDYVLEFEKTCIEDISDSDVICKIFDYANFLKQNLSEPYEVNGVMAHPLNRFVPCDLEGNVLEEPNKGELIGKKFNTVSGVYVYGEEYQQAKDRVLFEGCTFEKQKDYYIIYHNNTILWLSWNKSKVLEMFVDRDLTLTPTGAKMCGKEFEK